jgi:hypothetical protein
MKSRYRKRPNKPPIWFGYRNPDRRNTDTYADRRIEKISISVESIGASPGWHHDAVEGSAFVAVMSDATSSVILFFPTPLLELDFTDIDGHHEHFRDRAAVWSARIGATLGG